jgi:hypothetical protein
MYDPLTGNYIPDSSPMLTPFGQAGGEVEQLLARLNKSAGNVDRLQKLSEIANNPAGLSAGQLRDATAADREVATQARRNLQQANIALGAARSTVGGNTPLNTALKTEAQIAAETAAAGRKAERQSAYDLLYSQFAQYGLGALVDPLKGLIVSGASPAEFTIKLRESDAYQKRFAANKERIAKGLRAIDEATYIGLEDQYQKLMRNYGLPASYYTKDAMGTQPGFEKFIANDVSAVELEDRIATAQKRVINANPEVSFALKNFYPDITNGDILAYTLDPTKGLEDIKRKITSAEIGGAALRSGLTTSATDAEYLQKYGIDKATAEKGYTTIGAGLQRGSELASIYQENPYTQTTAEQEIFNVPGAAEARNARQKITGLEKAAFSGKTGLTTGALARDRAGGI